MRTSRAAHSLPAGATRPSDAENLVDEIDVVHAARDQTVDLQQHLVNAALAELVAEELLITECAIPWAAASILDLRSTSAALVEDVMPMPVPLHVVIGIVEGSKRFHVHHAYAAAQCSARAVAETHAIDQFPGFGGQRRQCLLTLALDDNVRAGFVHAPRAVWPSHADRSAPLSPAADSGKPLAWASRSSGGGQRQNRYDGAEGMTR